MQERAESTGLCLPILQGSVSSFMEMRFERQDEDKGRAASNVGGGGTQYSASAAPRSGSRAGAQNARPQNATNLEAPCQNEKRPDIRAPQVAAHQRFRMGQTDLFPSARSETTKQSIARQWIASLSLSSARAFARLV